MTSTPLASVAPVAAPDWPRVSSEAETFARRIALLYKNLLTGVSFGTLTLVIMLVPMVLAGPLHPVIRTWAFASAFWLAVGFSMCFLYRRSARLGSVEPRFWAWLATAGGGIAGLLWGALAPLVMQPGLEHFETYVVTGLCLLSVGAALGYAVYLPAMVAFSIGILVPVALSFAWQGDATHVVMAIFAVQCCAALIAFGVEFSRALRRDFELTARVSALARDLEVEKQQVMAASAAKSRFLAATSHDLRQPVHAIGLYAGALTRFVGNDDGLRILQRLQGAVRALDGLFEALQDISRIDAGVVPVQRRAFPVRQLFEMMDLQFRAAAELKGLALDIESTDVVVESDRGQLERILANLVSNAIRYTREGRVRLCVARDGEFAVLRVEDTGVGIAPEDRETIFEEFVQLANPERDRNKGLGLGLAIVRRLADLLGHSLELESEPGRGSRFGIRVPRVRADAAFEPADDAQAAVPASVPGRLPGSFVLVIDDERDVLDAMTLVLEQSGAYVLTASSGAEAVEKIAREDRLPDIVVSDLRLRGGETGTLAVARVREAIGEPVPALLVTGDTAPERVAEAAASGLILLHKPLRPERLTAALSRALAGN